MVEDLRPRILTIANELLDQMADSTEADLIDSFAFPLPIIVIAEMLGIPAADRDQFRKWTKILLFSGDYDDNKSALMEFSIYMNQMIDERQTNPQSDIISALVQAEENGDTLNRLELMSMLFLLLVAGHETTVNLIGNGTLALMQHPQELRKLRENRALMKSAIEEMLRFNGPVDLTTMRWAFEDVALGDTVIPQGAPVVASLLAANRDPQHFPNPDQFDITRDPNKHIAFGTGIHYCVGAPLARLEGAIALNALLDRLPRLELACDESELEWRSFVIIHGMTALPVRYTP
jgi:cytochrome P450 PksS